MRSTKKKSFLRFQSFLLHGLFAGNKAIHGIVFLAGWKKDQKQHDNNMPIARYVPMVFHYCQF
jgi:hypothetical protein